MTVNFSSRRCTIQQSRLHKEIAGSYCMIIQADQIRQEYPSFFLHLLRQQSVRHGIFSLSVSLRQKRREVVFLDLTLYPLIAQSFMCFRRFQALKMNLRCPSIIRAIKLNPRPFIFLFFYFSFLFYFFNLFFILVCGELLVTCWWNFNS